MRKILHKDRHNNVNTKKMSVNVCKCLFFDVFILTEIVFFMRLCGN